MEAHRRNGTRLTVTRVPKATARFVSCKVWYRALLVLIVAGFTILTEAQTAGSQSIGSSPACPSKTRPIYQFPFLRYDEDWSFLSCSQQMDRWDRIKYLPLGKNGSYLSLGGDVRGVYESYDNQYWGQGPQNQSGWVVHHYLFHGDLHLNSSIRLFGELQSAFENGRNGGPRPYDENKLDIHQAFFDVRCCRSPLSVTARIGRQELYYGSGRLVDARFGLKMRESASTV